MVHVDGLRLAHADTLDVGIGTHFLGPCGPASQVVAWLKGVVNLDEQLLMV